MPENMVRNRDRNLQFAILNLQFAVFLFLAGCGSSHESSVFGTVTLDGKPLEKPWLYQSELVDGGKLVLVLGPEPNKQWGTGPDAIPPQGR